MDFYFSRELNSKGVNLGDIGLDIAVGKTFSNGMMMLGGVVTTLPSATDNALGREQWLLPSRKRLMR